MPLHARSAALLGYHQRAGESASLGSIETIFEWIARHETVLSGIAAAIVIVGVVVAPVVRALRRLTRRAPGEPAAPSAPFVDAPAPQEDDARPSVAVMPFVDRSPGVTMDGLCDGLLEDLIAALSRIKPFFVIARSSMLTYRDRDVDPRDVARELGVRYVITGSVVTSGDALRLTAELVDARTGEQVDTQRFERPQAELFDLQDDIVHHVVASLQPALKGAEADRAQRSETESLDAWAIVNRAHIRLNQNLSDRDATLAAIADARRALELDSEYGLAWAVLGLALALAWTHRFETASSELDVEAGAASRRAAELDPNDAAVQHCVGATMGNLGRTAEAVRAYTRALELDPNAAASYGGLGAALVFAKRAEDAKDSLDKAIRLSPRDPLLYHWVAYRGLAELVIGRFEQARDDARASLDRVRGRVALAVLAVAQANLGAQADARAAYDELRALDPAVNPAGWANVVESTVREDYERSQLVEGMWLASGLARDDAEPRD